MSAVSCLFRPLLCWSAPDANEYAMRIVIDIMIGLMVVGVVAGGLYLYNNREQSERDVESVRVALQQLQEQAAYHRTVQSAMADRDVLLVHLHAEWFGEDVPTNLLLTEGRPWIDLAPPGDLGQHPPDPVVYGETQAGFWYNPTTGIFRARVSPATSEAQTLALYNEVNGSALPAFEQIPDPSRQPLAHILGTTPAKQYASMANKTWSEPIEEETLDTDLLVGEPSAEPAAQIDAIEAQVNRQAEPQDPNKNLDQNDQVLPEIVDDPIDGPEKRPTLNGD